MNLAKLNTIAYRLVAVVICLFLAIGSWGIYENHFYNRAYVGMVAAVIIAVCAFQAPSVKWWVIMVSVLVFAMFLVGVIGSYEASTHI
jgi:chromate transport protein ChrA